MRVWTACVEEVLVVNGDHVVLSGAERAALAELVAALPAEDAWLAAQLSPAAAYLKLPPLRTGKTRRGFGPTPLLGVVALISLLVAGVLAVAATGDVAWSGWLLWAWGTLAAVWLVSMKSRSRRPQPKLAIAPDTSGRRHTPFEPAD
jgi:hypothetical protein